MENITYPIVTVAVRHCVYNYYFLFIDAGIQRCLSSCLFFCSKIENPHCASPVNQLYRCMYLNPNLNLNSSFPSSSFLTRLLISFPLSRSLFPLFPTLLFTLFIRHPSGVCPLTQKFPLVHPRPPRGYSVYLRVYDVRPQGPF